MQIHKKKKQSEEKTTTSTWKNQDVANSSFGDRSSFPSTSSSSVNLQHQLPQNQNNSGFARMSISAPTVNNQASSVQAKETTTQTDSPNLDSAKTNSFDHNSSSKQGLLRKQVAQNITQKYNVQPKTYNPQQHSSHISRQIQLYRENDRSLQTQNEPTKEQSKFFSSVPAIQASSIIQRDIDPLAFEQGVSSKQITTINTLVTQYNELDGDSEDVDKLTAMVDKLRKIAQAVKKWIASLQGKQTKIEDQVDLENETKKSSSWKMSNWFSTKKKVGKYKTKTQKINSLQTWLSGTVEPELKTKNKKLSQAYLDKVDVITTENEDKYLTGSGPENEAASSIHTNLVKDQDYSQLTLGQTTAIRTYTGSIHSLMNTVMQAPQWYAKKYVKDKLVYEIPPQVKFVRQALLANYIQENPNKIESKVMFPNELEALNKELEAYKGQELLRLDLNLFKHLKIGEIVGSPDKVNDKTTFDRKYAELMSKLTGNELDQLVDQVYEEVKVQNTMLVEGLENLPSSNNMVYRGDWDGPTYWGKTMNFGFFGSATKDPRIAMTFFNHYRKPPEKTKTNQKVDSSVGVSQGWYKTPVLVEIELTGAGGGKDISMISGIKKEEEVLLMPGTVCDIVKREKKTLSNGQTYYSVKAKEQGGVSSSDNKLELNIDELVKMDLSYIKKYMKTDSAQNHTQMQEYLETEESNNARNSNYKATQVSDLDKQINQHIDSSQVVTEDTFGEYLGLELFLYDLSTPDLKEKDIMSVVSIEEIIELLKKGQDWLDIKAMEADLIFETEKEGISYVSIRGDFYQVKNAEYTAIKKIAQAIVNKQIPDQSEVSKLKNLQES